MLVIKLNNVNVKGQLLWETKQNTTCPNLKASFHLK